MLVIFELQVNEIASGSTYGTNIGLYPSAGSRMLLRGNGFELAVFGGRRIGIRRWTGSP
jgi:hypothetical protein